MGIGLCKLACPLQLQSWSPALTCSQGTDNTCNQPLLHPSLLQRREVGIYGGVFIKSRVFNTEKTICSYFVW